MVSVKVELDGADGVEADLAERIRRVGDLQPAMEAGAEALQEAVEQRFQTETAFDGSPWADLDPEYAKRRKPGTILTQERVLRTSVHTHGDENGITFGADAEYAAAHLYGTARMPARPFFPVTPDGEIYDEPGTPAGELFDEIEATILDYVTMVEEETGAG